MAKELYGKMYDKRSKHRWKHRDS